MLHQPSELKMTNLEIIESFVRSIMSSKNIVASTGKMVVSSKPLFVIVGSYFDELKEQLKKQSLIDENFVVNEAATVTHYLENKSAFMNRTSRTLSHQNLCNQHGRQSKKVISRRESNSMAFMSAGTLDS